MKRLTKEQVDAIRDKFNGHPFFEFSCSAFYALVPLCEKSTCFMRYDAQLFYSASVLLDQTISHSDIVNERFWPDLYADFQDATHLLGKDFNEEIAMLLYVVAYTIKGVPGIKDSSKMTGDILRLIRKHLNDINRVRQFSSTLNKVTHKHNEALIDWLADYTSGETLTQKINTLLND